MGDVRIGGNGEQAAENFLADVQLRLLVLMDVKHVGRAELATRLGVHRSRVTQMLGASSNLTVATLGRVFEALDEVPELTSTAIRHAINEAAAEECSEDALHDFAQQHDGKEDAWSLILNFDNWDLSRQSIEHLEFANESGAEFDIEELEAA